VSAQAEPWVEPREGPLLASVGGVNETEEPPAWRGVSHEKAFGLAPALAILLVLSADGPRAQAAAILFAATMTGMLGASALNHRGSLDERWIPWIRRADHAAIYVFLAGTWTAVAVATLPGRTTALLATIVWGAALVAALASFAWVDAPGWTRAAFCFVLGWTSPAAFVNVAGEIGATGVSLFVLGGALYTAAAIVYALRRPGLTPAFGYHELFHALVLAGVACHYVTLAVFVLPLAA
jgi:hemolysin III